MENGGKNKRIVNAHARLTPETKELLLKLCEAKGQSVSELVRQLIIDELTRQGFITSKIERIKQEIIGEAKSE